MALYFEYKYAVLSKLICLVPKFHTNWPNLGPYKSTLNKSELLNRTWLRRKGAGMVSWQFVHYWFPDWAVRVWTRVEVNVSCGLSEQDIYRIFSLPIDIKIPVYRLGHLSSVKHLKSCYVFTHRFSLIIEKRESFQFDVQVDLPITTSPLLYCQIPRLIQRIIIEQVTRTVLTTIALPSSIQTTCTGEIGELSLFHTKQLPIRGT